MNEVLRVDSDSSGRTDAKSADELALEIIAGRRGVIKEGRRSLGSRYAELQRR